MAIPITLGTLFPCEFPEFNRIITSMIFQSELYTYIQCVYKNAYLFCNLAFPSKLFWKGNSWLGEFIKKIFIKNVFVFELSLQTFCHGKLLGAGFQKALRAFCVEAFGVLWCLYSIRCRCPCGHRSKWPARAFLQLVSKNIDWNMPKGHSGFLERFPQRHRRPIV